MQKAKSFAIVLRQRRPIRSRLFQQIESPVHVGADKIVGTMNRAVYVTFGCEVNNGPGPLAFEQIAQQIAIDDVTLLKAVTVLTLHRLQIMEIASVGELVEIQDTG